MAKKASAMVTGRVVTNAFRCVDRNAEEEAVIAASAPDDRLIEHRRKIFTHGEIPHQLRAIDRDEVLLGIDEDMCGGGAGPAELTDRPKITVLGWVHQH